jgi:hypothetical protein
MREEAVTTPFMTLPIAQNTCPRARQTSGQFVT